MATKSRVTGGRTAAKPQPAKPGGKPGGRPTPPRPTPPPTVEPGGGGGGVTNDEAEPPIIVQGGSLTIESPVFLAVSYDEARQLFIYKNDAVNIKEFEAKGRGNPHRDPTNNGQFRIMLER